MMPSSLLEKIYWTELISGIEMKSIKIIGNLGFEKWIQWEDCLKMSLDQNV